MMKKIMAGVSALAIAASAALIPTKADAHVWWLWPAIVGGTVGGLAIGAAAANNAHGYYGGPGYCHPGRERGPDGRWHRVTVCE
jgi:hypothetical protein